MGSIFFGMTIIICLAAFLSLLFRTIRQPAILAYILTGILISHIGAFNAQYKEVLQSLAEVGITLLLFMLGLEIKLSELFKIGKVVGLVGTGEMVLLFTISYVLSIILGFDLIAALYIGIVLTFSSTIIVVKLLSDKKDLHSLYGKIAIGILLLQDFIAIILLIFLSSFSQFSSSSSLWSTSLALFYKGLIILLIVMLLSKFILPKILQFAARSSETLFLFSLAWVFGISAIVSSSYIGFSIEIGGFLAGLALSTMPENYQISAKMKTLRDFFIILFFVLLGMQMSFGNVGNVLIQAVIFSIVILLVSPIIIMIFMGAMGYRKRTGLFTGICLAQISEFSLIIVFLGNRLGHISSDIITLVTIIGVITFVVSTYMIVYSNKIYRISNSYLGIFEKKGVKIDDVGAIGELTGHVVLIGAHRMGESILHALHEMNEQIVVVDFNPDIVDKLRVKEIASLFGDITDTDIQERAQLHKAKLVISTMPDFEDNCILIKQLNKLNRRAKIVVMGQDREEAKILYNIGADYVVLPHIAGGRHVARILQGDHLQNLKNLKESDFMGF